MRSPRAKKGSAAAALLDGRRKPSVDVGRHRRGLTDAGTDRERQFLGLARMIGLDRAEALVAADIERVRRWSSAGGGK